MTSRRKLLALIAATITLTACATPPVVNNNRDQPTTPSTVAAATVGTTQTVTGGKVTLHEIRDNITRGTFQPKTGNRWIGIDIETCVDATSTIDTARWQLHDATNHQYQPSNAYDDMPAAGYTDGTLNAGTCKRGWLPYQMPTGETISTITYTSGNGTVITWK